MRFSQRIGKTPIKSVLQVGSIDPDLLNRLWNTLLDTYLRKLNDNGVHGEETELGEVCKLYWKEFFNNPIDEISMYSDEETVYTPGFIDFLRKWFFNAEWFEVYDILEFTSRLDSRVRSTGFTKECNWALEKEVSGYRIVKEKVVQMTTEEEISAIEEAIKDTDSLKSVNTHLEAALKSLADRKSPNYRNSIKESISAVESFCKIITKDDKATLGKALVEIEKKYPLHGAIKTAFSALYGYTSDSGGIRHSLIESDKEEPKFEDAKFMLVTCSAFINYLKVKTK